MNVTAHKLYDYSFDNWKSEIEDKYEYDDMRADDRLRVEWISFDCVMADPDSELVYLGITSFDADIFRAYDRKTGDFVDLGFSRVADPFDAKFHRSLVKSKDGCVYGAIALLHDVDRYWEAPGGSIVRYDPGNDDIEKMGIPVPHTYIQGMVIDENTRKAYCQCFTPEYLAEFDLETRESRILGLTGSGFGMGQGENIVMDRKGRVWGTWSVTRAWQSDAGVDQYRLYRYDPEKDKIEFFRRGIPHLDTTRAGYCHIDGMVVVPDGRIYCGSAEGGLYRIDEKTGAVSFVAAPVPPARLAAFAMGPDGFLYGIGGRYGNASLFRMNLDTEQCELLGLLRDPDIGESAWQIHDMDFAPDGAIFAGENDNPLRSSYLWEIRL